MKKVLVLFMLGFSAIAMAGTKEREKAPVKAASLAFIPIHEEGNGNTKNDTLQSKKKEAPLATQLSGEGARFDLSVYIVDFINRSNIKIAKRILKD
ncbi:hypothetical protein KJK34_07445 [Flavobacterium sp. D11R37]|uniref:hypothetical protein n=1 Tax=Flavobacterium coralii TaxID=2838017 RepID=UPI001CA72EF2|nr:hypothetical protein [Flavobacterium coralii]MBY8962583.1 hypothetical protein [Flavobacterium coralii]